MATLSITSTAVLVFALAACGQPAGPDGSLFASGLEAQRSLSNRLQEVSGLAVSADGRLFGHDDEIGVIYEINPATGDTVTWFAVGDDIATGDFEGLSITPSGEFWLAASTGELYRFREAPAHARAPVERFDAGVRRVCEVEGVAYLAAAESLILACKRYYGRDVEDQAALRLWPIGGDSTTPWGPTGDALAAAAGVRRFQPSDVTIDPATGRIIVISADNAALVELSPDGAILAASPLGATHRQAEGAAVMRDGSLVIADEGGNDQSLLTRYARAP